MIRVGVVVQRYGNEVLGGAETLAREIAERLNAFGFDLTVFTTTAKDYVTWGNEYKPGNSILKGVNIKRFSVEKERNIGEFNTFSSVFFNQPPEERDELQWILQQGPFTPDLVEALEKEQENFDLFIFFTYLYYPTVQGTKVINKPVILFPTAHDEAPIYLKVMDNVFKKPEALFFLTGAERDFVQRRFNPFKRLQLIRTGIDINEGIGKELFQRNYNQFTPFILYAGRIEKGKGLETVFKAYAEIKKRYLIDLVLIGKKLMEIPQIDGIKYVGFVSEEEKLSAFKGAILSLQPSSLESLSITTLESFTQRTPVLVNKKSPVLNEHVEISGGGMAYHDVNDLVECFCRLYEDKKGRRDMGLKGYYYVKTHFSWENVVGKIRNQIEKIVGASRAGSDDRSTRTD
jgi:glycosyltransferase involved in cell wall biosynthesis